MELILTFTGASDVGQLAALFEELWDEGDDIFARRRRSAAGQA